MTQRVFQAILRWVTLPITLLLFGCPVGLDPCTNAQVLLNKDLNCPRLEIPAGQTRTFAGQIKVTSSNIIVNGSLSGTDGSAARPDGSSLQLDCAGGTLEIGGRVQAGNGLNQTRPARVSSRVRGDAGGDGGDITITTCASLDIGAAGRLQAGNGGRGQNATAQGSENLVTATSGAGGRGGDILISRVQRSVIVGDLQAGNGNTSGEARATGMVAPGTEQFPIRVEADGTEGPRGGNVTLRLTDPQSTVFISRNGAGQQPLRNQDPTATAGNGGPAGTATATGGDQSSAISGNAGNGGEVNVVLCPTCGFNFSNATTVPGNGARTTLPQQEAATATGFSQGSAKAGNGGDGGRVVVGGNPTVVEGDGGASGTARAQTTDGSCRLQRGDDPMGARQGGGSTEATVVAGAGDQCP